MWRRVWVRGAGERKLKVKEEDRLGWRIRELSVEEEDGMS